MCSPKTHLETIQSHLFVILIDSFIDMVERSVLTEKQAANAV